MSILVFGSLNLDLVARTPQLPIPGETILGQQFVTTPGGKGGNQAVAIARQGISTTLIGRVGADHLGQEILQSLQQAGIDTSAIRVDRSIHSGVALIAVDDRGENQIIVVPGANGQVDATDVDQLMVRLPAAGALLLQLEIPLDAVWAAAQAAHQAGVPVILDPAPAIAQLPPDLYPLIDYLTPNEVEAAQLVSFTLDGPEAWSAAAMQLRDRGVGTVLIKLGAQGVWVATPEESFRVPAFPVTAIDTVAAGDAFNGGLAAALVRGMPLREAVTWATATAALAVMQPGAQSAMPDRQAVETFLAQASSQLS